MLRFFLSIILIQLLCSYSLWSWAQYPVSNQYWAGVELEKAITKNLGIGLKSQLRLQDGAWKSNLFDISATYKLPSEWKIGGGYRFTIKEQFNKHRIYAEVGYKQKMKSAGLALAFRGRLQHDKEDKEQTNTYFRPKFVLSQHKKKAKFSPFVSFELFYALVMADQQFDAFRIGTGLNWDIDKRFSAKLAYTLQREINVAAPEISHIFATGLSIDIDKWIKQQRKKKKGKK